MQLLRYRSPDGVEPITIWLAHMRDKTVQARLRLRLRLLQAGDWGDAKPVGGGDKSTQAQDIRKARAHWRHWKESQT